MDGKITYSRRKSLSLRIAPDGSLDIRAPIGMPRREIDRFLEEKADWIATHRAQVLRDRQQGAQYSPAYTMASRIRNEQGRDRAAEYLGAMEPFLAPGEREHIAKMLDIPLPQRQYTPPPPQYAPPQYVPPQRPAQGPQAMPNMGGMGDTMQLMQLLSSIGGMGKGGSPLGQSGGGMNPLMLAQLLGNMMGRR